MGTSANFDDTDTTRGGTGGAATRRTSQPDDLPAADAGTTDTGDALNTSAGTGERGTGSRTRDTVGQLQDKANELTSRLMDGIDVDDLTRKLEQEIRDHPARTLLLAIGAGFLLGRSARK